MSNSTKNPNPKDVQKAVGGNGAGNVVPMRVPLVGGRRKEPPIPPKVKRQMLAEFKRWKKHLHDLIDRGSQLQVNAQTFEYQFILPTQLVKLVWGTTMKERIKAEQANGLEKEEAEKEAVRKLRQEMDEGQQLMMEKGAVEQSARAEVDEEEEAKRNEEAEAQAKANLEKFRADLISGKAFK